MVSPQSSLARPLPTDGIIASKSATPPLKGPEKAAVIIGLLGPDYAGPIVEKIEDHHLRRFMTALNNLKDIPRDIMLGAVADRMSAR